MNATMTKLVSFGTHHTVSGMTDPVHGISAARDWLAAEMCTLAAGAPHISIAVPLYIQPTSRILVPMNVSDMSRRRDDLGRLDPEPRQRYHGPWATTTRA